MIILEVTLCNAVANRIEELLTEHNLTAYQLYKMSGVAQSTISDIRNVKSKAINVNNISAICQAVGISLKEFFDRPYFENVND